MKTSKQLGLTAGFGNTASGKLNQRALSNKHKQIELEDFEVEMLSPSFFPEKTLKKPLTAPLVEASTTNPYFAKPTQDSRQKEVFQQVPLGQAVMEDPRNLNQTRKVDYSYLNLGSYGSIQPAYRPVSQVDLSSTQHQFKFSLEDKNTVFSAMTKKGTKPKKSITFADDSAWAPKENKERAVGKAEAKLKKLFNKGGATQTIQHNLQNDLSNKLNSNSEELIENIEESINEYADEEFQQFSQESGAIRESIREDIGGSSGMIKESIREEFGNSSSGNRFKGSIAEEIKESIRSASKGQISEAIGLSHYSSSNIKEEIPEDLSGSQRSKVEKSAQEVYSQIFEDYEESMSRSRGTFKKSGNIYKESDPLSKSFRKKTNVVKSIKLAQELNNKTQLSTNKQESKKNSEESERLTAEVLREKTNLSKRKVDLNKLLNPVSVTSGAQNRNACLLYEFKIELNKLATGKNFASKLQKLTSFINCDQSQQLQQLNSLEDQVLKNVLKEIQGIRRVDSSLEEIEKIKADYDEKLQRMLREQETGLRVQMDKKLHERDLELKKMIAELEQKFQNQTLAVGSAKFDNFLGANKHAAASDLLQIDSDYSIDSDNVSWKADLWEVLPDYEKKRLYEKQSKEVTHFLTNLMMEELKEESLSRSLDISFEFPGEESAPPQVSEKKKFVMEEDTFVHKAPLKKQSSEAKVCSSITSLSGLPQLKKPPKKEFTDESLPLKSSARSENVNQYSKVEGEQPIEPTKKCAGVKEKVVQVLSKYKGSYLRKKNDMIRKIMKTLLPKQSAKRPSEHLASVIQELNILTKEEVNPEDLVYVRAYEEELIWGLVSVMDRCQDSKKMQAIEAEMRNSYERLLILCQAQTAEKAEETVNLDLYDEKKYQRLKGNIAEMECKPCPIEVVMGDEVFGFMESRKCRQVKDQIVEDIVQLLATEFGKEFPRRSK